MHVLTIGLRGMCHCVIVGLKETLGSNGPVIGIPQNIVKVMIFQNDNHVLVKGVADRSIARNPVLGTGMEY